MKTYQITENEIKGMPVLATGYKIFNNDWTTKKGTYDYKNKDGEVLNTIHKVDGKLSECNWGLHFSKLPHNCFNFYESVQWNKFAKVEAYGECIDSCDNKKSIAKILKIVEIYSFNEFVNLIQEELQNQNISGGNYIRGGNDIWGGNDICGGNYIRGGNDISGGNYIRGGNNISGGNYIWGATKCDGISRCLFCYDFTGKLHAFNKPISEERFNEIFYKLINFDWFPKFNNAYDLKGNLEWYETNIPNIVKVDNKTAWGFMPKEMLDYIKSLPEFDQEIFDKVTGDIKND